MKIGQKKETLPGQQIPLHLATKMWEKFVNWHILAADKGTFEESRLMKANQNYAILRWGGGVWCFTPCYAILKEIWKKQCSKQEYKIKNLQKQCPLGHTLWG